MVVGKALGIDQLRAEPDEALLEAFGLGDAAERGDLAPLERVQPETLAGKHIFEIQRVMNTFDDASR